MSYKTTMADLKELYDNLWDASFIHKGQNCGIFPNSITDILVCIGSKDYIVSSFEELVNLDVEGVLLLEILDKTEVQYY